MDFDCNYEPKGTIKSNPITVIGFYVMGVVCAISGAVMYFTVLQDISIILIMLGIGIFCALLGVMMKDMYYCWNDEFFTVKQPLVKAVTYSFDDIANVGVDYRSINLYMKNRKTYVISRTDIGSDKFLAKLKGADDLPELPE